VDLWDELLSLAESDPAFRFLMDGQAVVIEDYLAIRPGAQERLDRAVTSGAIAVGPWYTLPDEFLVTGETLVRNLERGIAVADAHGGAMRAGYLPDTFGHAAQMPQIYRQFGFRHAVVWRGVPSTIDRLAFIWEGPDGSRVLTAYMASSYSQGVDLPLDGPDLAARMRVALEALAPYRPGTDVLLMNGNDHVHPQQRLSRAVREAMDHLDGIQLRLSRLEDYLARLDDGGWPVWQGELRSSARANILMGTLSVRVPDKQQYFLAGQTLERYAEPLVAIAGLDASGLLHEAWTMMLYNAAHDTACGSGIDAVAEESQVRTRSALQLAQAVRDRAISRLVSGTPRGSEPTLAWNPSPFSRAGLVEITLPVAPEGAQDLGPAPSPAVQIFRFPSAELARVLSSLDEQRLVAAVQRVGFERRGPLVVVSVDVHSSGPEIDLDPARQQAATLAADPSVERFELRVTNLPLRRALISTVEVAGCGIGTVRTEPPATPARAGSTTLENGRLRCRVETDGTLSVDDLETGVSYKGLHRLVDEGDAGDEYNFSPVEAGALVDQPEGPASVRVIENGPLRATLEIDLRYSIPSELTGDRRRRAPVAVRMPVTVRVSLAAASPQLDFEVRLENLARDHRLRAHIPLPFTPTHSDADTAFHVTRRPVQPPRHEPGAPEWELPTFPMRSFVDASDGVRGAALITQGLHEYEVLAGPPSVLALTLLRAVGWLSRDDLAYRTGHAGPALKTPGAQVLGQQQFHYSVRFHDGGWEAANLWRVAESTILPMLVLPPGTVPDPDRSIELEPDSLQMTALIPREGGYDLRLLNASTSSSDGVVHIRPHPRSVSWVSLAGELKQRLAGEEGAYRVGLKAWEIATLRVQR